MDEYEAYLAEGEEGAVYGTWKNALETYLLEHPGIEL
jgi:hypothetical protein